MDPGGSDPPRRQVPGKQVAGETPRRRRNRRPSGDVVLNIGNMRQGHTYVGPPNTQPTAPQRPPSPHGPGFYHFPSHGRHRGPPSNYHAGHMGPPSMPTPSPQNDVDPDIEDDEDDEDDVDPEQQVVIIDGVRVKVIYPSGDA